MSQKPFDSSALGLLISNVVVIILSITGDWSFKQILWVYWSQSIIIGFFHFFRLLSVNKFSLGGFSVYTGTNPKSLQEKLGIAILFAFHYGFAHWAYAAFLGALHGPINLFSILLGSSIFAVNHFYSFIHNRASDRKKVVDLNGLLLAPYGRVVPMHAVVVLGFLGGGTIGKTFFLSLKTVVDVVAHSLKHRS